MTHSKTPKNTSSFFDRLFGPLCGKNVLIDEKAQLEAMMHSYPGEFFALGPQGGHLTSEGLSNVLRLDKIETIDDIQSRLSPDDAAALEGLFMRLQKDATSFVISVLTHDEQKHLKISGTAGRSVRADGHFCVLWIDDVSAEVQAHQSFMAEIALQEAQQEKLEAMLDHVPRPLWLRDTAQDLVWVNDTYADFLNKDKAEILEKQKEVFGHLRRRPSAAQDEVVPGKDMAAKALRTGEIIESRVHNTIKGARMLMNVTEIPMRDRNMTLGVAYNVTREEELEREMMRYLSSNQELLEQLRSAVAIFGPEQNLTFYNMAFAQLWTLDDEWLNKKPKLGDILDKLREMRRLPEQADFRAFKKRWLDMFTGLIHPFEDMMYLPDNSALRLLVVPSSNGGLMMTFEDVTSSLELESSYNTLIAVQRETLDNLVEGVAVFGGDGRLKLYNPSYTRLWQLNPEDLEGEPHVSRLIERMRPFFDEGDWAQKKDKIINKVLHRRVEEGRLVRADDTLLDYTTVPLPDGGVLITYTDVTDSVQVETALRDKNSALEAAEKLKLDFLANVSYQLRTPLNALMGFNEILDQEYFGSLNAKQKEYTADMRRASTRLLDLINDILDLSSLEAGYLTLSRADLKISNVLHSVHDLVQEWARKQDIQIHMKVPKTIGTFTVDEQRIKQALINLIRNAIAHTPSGGEITLKAQRKKDGILLQVIDNGVGIKEEDRERIFEPFQRAQAGSMEARLSHKGAGLGLSLVKNIISLHGGTVDLTSAPNQGTTASLFLPFTAVPTKLKLPIAKKAKT